MQTRWKLAKSNIILQSRLSRELSISPTFAQLLINRGLDDREKIEYFLRGNIESLFDPFKLPDMELAVRRIRQSAKNKDKVLIFGDYDVDGISACALLKSTLKKEYGLEVLHHLPHRVKEGYGLNREAIKKAKEAKVDLFISVDCGISSFSEVAFLKELDIDTIIVDHHQPLKGKLPCALAIINPKRQDSHYPYSELAAVGLAYKFAQAFTGRLLEDELDLVSLGTVADAVPLNGENRILVKEGLRLFRQTKRVGLKKLMEVAGIKGKEMHTGYISYILGPRINAAGRIDSAETSLKLLLSQSEEEALRLADDLNLHNRKRQEIESEVMEEALSLIEREVNFKENHIIVLSQEDWHEGVLGIIASRLAERFYRPTIVISMRKNLGKGSARSINNFHILEALSECTEHLVDFGGHRFAAGLTILKDELENFKAQIYKIAKMRLSGEDLYPSVDIEVQISLSALNPELIEEIERLAPFGIGNPKPVFCSRNLYLKSKPCLLGKDVIKMWVTDGRLTYAALGFGMANYFDLVCDAKSIDLAYTPFFDTWEGNRQIELAIKDIRFNSG